MKVYLDYSATTPVDPRILKDMTPYFTDIFGNANSVHSFGRESAYAVDESRRNIASLIGAKPQEIYFTSGGTESDNWAIKGVARKLKSKGNNIIVSAVEHAAVLSSCEQLKKEGFSITYLPVDEFGRVSVESLKKAISDKTVLVSIMTANNEIGTIMPIKELAATAHAKGVLFHTDAVQALGSIPVNVIDSGVDLMSFSAHKFYGPKGIGVLCVKSGVEIEKIISGGHQEKSFRGGTTDTPLIVGMCSALSYAVNEMKKSSKKILSLKDYFVTEVEKRIPDVIYNGDRNNRLPQNANFSFLGIEGESLLLALDLVGIACSSGAACSSGSLEPSHVLIAIGRSKEVAKESIRFSFGKNTTKDEVDYVIDNLVDTTKRLREVNFSLFKQTDSKRYRV